MKAALFAYSRRGCETALSVKDALAGWDVRAFTVQRLAQGDFAPLEKPTPAFYGALFQSCDALIFVGAAGIAVREIAPHVRDKRTDPAVLCIDELGQYVIPLLSGHIGGANELAAALADKLDAQAIITTATDINRKFSVDAWAAKNGCIIDNMAAAKAVSAAILEHPVFLKSDFPIGTELPSGVEPGDTGDTGIVISTGMQKPFSTTLRLIPPVLTVGIGCRKGTPLESIRQAVEEVFLENGLDLRAVKGVASIDLKAQEQGLLEYCKEMNWPVRFYSADELLSVKGVFTASAFVKSVTGVDNVCERAAKIASDRLIVRKTAKNGVTVAVAEEKWEVRFG